MDNSVYKIFIEKLTRELRNFYGSRLVTFSIFGSYARNQMRSDSDLDLLIISKDLPDGRMARVREFMEVEKKMEPEILLLKKQSFNPYFSPIFKTPEEAKRGSPLFLDMTQEIEILFDRDNFFKKILEEFKTRLARLGSRRIWKAGGMWYWVLKPDSKPGEVIEL